MYDEDLGWADSAVDAQGQLLQTVIDVVRDAVIDQELLQGRQLDEVSKSVAVATNRKLSANERKLAKVSSALSDATEHRIADQGVRLGHVLSDPEREWAARDAFGTRANELLGVDTSGVTNGRQSQSGTSQAASARANPDGAGLEPGRLLGSGGEPGMSTGSGGPTFGFTIPAEGLNQQQLTTLHSATSTPVPPPGLSDSALCTFYCDQLSPGYNEDLCRSLCSQSYPPQVMMPFRPADVPADGIPVPPVLPPPPPPIYDFGNPPPICPAPCPPPGITFTPIIGITGIDVLIQTINNTISNIVNTFNNVVTTITETNNTTITQLQNTVNQVISSVNILNNTVIGPTTNIQQITTTNITQQQQTNIREGDVVSATGDVITQTAIAISNVSNVNTVNNQTLNQTVINTNLSSTEITNNTVTDNRSWVDSHDISNVDNSISNVDSHDITNITINNPPPPPIDPCAPDPAKPDPNKCKPPPDPCDPASPGYDKEKCEPPPDEPQPSDFPVDVDQLGAFMFSRHAKSYRDAWLHRLRVPDIRLFDSLRDYGNSKETARSSQSAGGAKP